MIGGKVFGSGKEVSDMSLRGSVADEAIHVLQAWRLLRYARNDISHHLLFNHHQVFGFNHIFYKASHLPPGAVLNSLGNMRRLDAL